MNPLSIEDVRMLAAAHPGPCVTLTLPTHRVPASADQDRILYRDLLLAADRDLQLSTPEREELLRPLRDLDTPEFWQHQTGGLAVYRAPGLATYFRVPGSLEAKATVGDHFRVKPLLPFLRADFRFLVLALAQNHVALFEGTPSELHPVHVPSMPASMREALGPEWRLRYLSAHSHGHGPLVFHGHGAPSEDTKPDVVRFFREVDKGLWPAVRELDLPLVLAGVDYYHPLYRQVSRYRHVADEGVVGSVERDTPAQLLARARPIVERLARARDDEVLAAFRHGEHSGRATTDLEAIGAAAVRGRVRTLLLTEDAALEGHLDPDRGSIVLRPGAEDVVEDLTEAVLVRGGDVRVLARERMPEGRGLAALLRW